MRWERAGLWAIFALLLIGGGGQFLFACGLTFAGRTFNYCPARPDDSALRAEIERGRALQRMIHMAELKLVEKPTCKPPPTPQPTPTPTPTVPDVYERGGEHGRYEILLAWRGHDDLDLKVFCPRGGMIGGQNGRPGSCGEGVVDVDANRNTKEHISDTPEEHAVWKTEAPDGELRVEAFLFTVVDADSRLTLPFEMTFMVDGQTKTCKGASQWIPRKENRRTRDGQWLSNRNAYLMWRPRNGLPTSCDWIYDEGHYCAPGECEKR